MSDTNYSSIYNIKEMAMKELAPKYFNVNDINDINIGLLGYVTELSANATEDTFNAVSILMNEFFPNTSMLPETTYTNAALFKISDIFAKPSELDVLLLIPEDDIHTYSVRKSLQTNGTTTSGDETFEFYIDSQLVIDVEGIQFMPDYDIKISYRRESFLNGDYIYSAQYVMSRYNTSYINSISNVTNPFITLKRIVYDNIKYLALLIKTHQVNKFTQTENLIDNNTINLPSYTITFEDNIAGFELFYKNPVTSEYTQLKKILDGDIPNVDERFCYYRMISDNSIEITFSAKTDYFQPAFNSELVIEYYITLGEGGNFDLYKGTAVSATSYSTDYDYNRKIIMYAIPQTASINGTNKLSIDKLKRSVIEKFSTVGSYTTDTDLQLYFDAFNAVHDSNVLFVKTRDDILERLFTSFTLFKDSNENIYHTNTLPLLLENISFENNITYIIKPGTLFSYKDSKSNVGTLLYNQYNEPWRLTSDANQNEEIIKALLNDYEIEEKLDDETTIITKPEFIYTNPYLIYFTKDPSFVGYYTNSINNTFVLDYEYINPDISNQFICNGLKITRDSILGSNTYKIKLMMNPTSLLKYRIITETKDNTLEDTKHVVNILSILSSDGNEIGCKKMTLVPSESDYTKDLYVYECELITNDIISSMNTFDIRNIIPINIESSKVIIDDSAEFDQENDMIDAPMIDCMIRIHTYVSTYDPENDDNYKVDDIFTINNNSISIKQYPDNNMNKSGPMYVEVNSYLTNNNPVTFIQPIQLVRSTLTYNEGTTTDDNGIAISYNVNISSVPFISAKNMIDDTSRLEFFDQLLSQYRYANDIIQLVTNNYSIDMKFYNTYGRSGNFKTDDASNPILDKVNINIRLAIKPLFGTDTNEFITNIKIFIKRYIESINEGGTNAFYVSNLIKSIENAFSEIRYMKFISINDYTFNVQVIENHTKDINTLTKEERLVYVPEYLTIALDDIVIETIN